MKTSVVHALGEDIIIFDALFLTVVFLAKGLSIMPLSSSWFRPPPPPRVEIFFDLVVVNLISFSSWPSPFFILSEAAVETAVVSRAERRGFLADDAETTASTATISFLTPVRAPRAAAGVVLTIWQPRIGRGFYFNRLLSKLSLL